MSQMNNDYDFLCSNDSKFIRIAIKNTYMHTMVIQSDTGREIDFTDGTKNIETILLLKCFKLAEIKFAEEMGAVKRLRIAYADTLHTLDVSTLIGLEELSIIDCGNLSSITGLPASLKQINIHRSPIETLDISGCSDLEDLNIITTAEKFNIQANDLHALTNAQIARRGEDISPDDTNKAKKVVTATFAKCPALRIMSIETGNMPATVDLQSIPNLTFATMNAGPGSKLSGLSGCVKLDMIQMDHPTNIAMDPAAQQMIKRLTIPEGSVPANDIKKEINHTFSRFRERALNTEPGTEDLETLIQQNGNARDNQRSCQVKIALLALPVALATNTSRNESSNNAIQSVTDLKKHLGNSPFLILYVDHAQKLSEMEPVLKTARIPIPENDTVLEWLVNKNKLTPNILLLTPASLTLPYVKKFLATLNPKKKLMIYNKQYFFLKPGHKIIADPATRKIIERFTKHVGIPRTLAEERHWLAALQGAYKIVASNPAIMAKPAALAALPPLAKVLSNAKALLSAVKTANPALRAKPTINASNVDIEGMMPSTSTRGTPSSALLDNPSDNSQLDASIGADPLAKATLKASYENAPFEVDPLMSAAQEALSESMPNITDESTMGQFGKLSNDSDTDLASARVNADAGAAGTQHQGTGQFAPTVNAAGQHGKITTDHEEDLTSAKANTEASYQPLETDLTLNDESNENAHPQQKHTGGGQSAATITLPEGQHGRITQGEEDINLASARADVDATAAGAQYASVTKGPQATAQFGEAVLLTQKGHQAGRATLITDQDEPDAILASARADVSATANAEDYDDVQAAKDIHQATLNFATTLDDVIKVAMQIMPTSVPETEMIENAHALLTDTINDLDNDTQTSSLEHLLKISEQSVSISRSFNRGVEGLVNEVDAPALTDNINTAPSVQATVNPRLSHEERERIRNDLIKASTRAIELLKENESAGIFGHAKSGITKMRIVYLTELRSSLKNHQTISDETLNQYIAELKKDKKLETILAPHYDAIREHLSKNSPLSARTPYKPKPQ